MPLSRVRWWMSQEYPIEFRSNNGVDSVTLTVNNDGNIGLINGFNTTWYSDDRVIGAEGNGSPQVILPRVTIRGRNYDEIASKIKEFVEMLSDFAERHGVCRNGEAHFVMIDDTNNMHQQVSCSIAYTADELTPEFDGGELDEALYYIPPDEAKEETYEGPRPTRFERKPVI